VKTPRGMQMSGKLPPGLEPWRAAALRVEEMKGVVPELADLPGLEPGSAPSLVVRLADTIEELRRRGIRDRIRLASMQEITESLLQERDGARILGTLARYLRQVFNLEEILVLRRLPRSLTWVGYHAERGRAATAELGAVVWRDEWAEPRLAPRIDVAAGPSTEAEAPKDPTDPSNYEVVVPLDGRGVNGVPPSGSDDAGGGPIGLLCFTPSATDRSEASWRPYEIGRSVEGVLEALWHREVMEAEGNLRRQLIEAMGDGLLAFDRDGRLVAANAAAARLLGFSAAKEIAIETLERTSPALLEHIRDALATGEAPPAREFALGESGSVPVSLTLSGLRDEDGCFSGLVVNLADLTDIRAMEREIQRLDRLAAIGRFAAGVAHEIRNPLAGIGAGVEYLASRLGPDPSDRDDLRIIRAEVARLDRIVAELLDYTHPRQLELSPVGVEGLAERVLLGLAPLLARRRVTLATQGPPDLEVWADADRLGQVLLNLAKNAVEASPSGSVVRLTWEPRGPADAALRCPGILFRVEDCGPGMQPEQRARAFEPFFTTKGEGTGLGLSLSHAIVTQHGGRLLLDEAPGRGTVALLELPPGGTTEELPDAVVHSPGR
jgi:PAS domain S-box-containing protein